MFHFAGIGDIVPSIERPTEYMATNVQGTVRVLEAARAAGVRKFVYAASSSCYGLAATPTREDHPIAPQYPYALSKYLGEQAALHWHQVYRLPVNSIRIFNAYGTRVRTTGAYGAVFGVFFKQKLAGKPFTVVGDGSQRRDFVYASDVAEAFWRAAMTPRSGEIWNLGAGNPQSVNRLVELIGGPVTYIPKRPGEPEITWADIGKITSELGWQPRIPFEDGVRRMIAEIDKWRDAPLWDAASIAAGHSRLVRLSWGGASGMNGLSDTYRHKIKNVEELRTTIGPRPRPRTVVMCHGVFDLVHPGHIRHLLYAKSKADILVASLTADVHIHKANYRPFVPQDLRALNLAALEMVDYVLIDEEATPLRNLALVQPDFFAKGYEYQNGGMHPKTQEEIATVERYGGEVLFTPGDIVYSSSALIESGPPDITIDKLLMLMDAEGIGFDQLRATLEGCRGISVHVVGDTIVDSLTHTTMIGGMTKTPTPSVRFDGRSEFYRRRRDRRGASARCRRRGHVFDRARRRPDARFRARRA